MTLRVFRRFSTYFIMNPSILYLPCSYGRSQQHLSPTLTSKMYSISKSLANFSRYLYLESRNTNNSLDTKDPPKHDRGTTLLHDD
jgi:hypothetical protein